MNQQLYIRKKKNKLYIVDNIISYPLTITDSDILCVCPEQIKLNLNKTDLFCKHIMFYVNCCKLDMNILKYWKRMKTNILTELLKTDFQKQIYCDNKNLWHIIETTLFNDECCCCLNPVSFNRDHHVCSHCGGITDEKCFRKWMDSGDKKGCMLCRQ